MQGGFIWDDNDHVTHNTAVQNPSGPADIWRRLGSTPQYYPLVFTSFWIEHALWGLNPFGYHLNNVLLHLLNAFLLWRVLLRLSIPAPWLAAAVFALHPLQVESAAWITERKNILSAVFYLGALLAYLRFAQIGPPARSAAAGWRCYALALLLFVAALLSKTVTCSLPAVILLLLWWKRGRVSWRAFVPLLPMLAIGVGMGLMTVWIEKSHIGATGSEWDLSWIERTLIAGRALWFYLGKLVWPADLMFWYPRWRIDVGEWQQFIYPAAFAGLTAALWISRRRIGRAPIVSLLIFSGTLMPALGFFDVYPMRFSFVADHFQYLAWLLSTHADAGVRDGAEAVRLAERAVRLTGGRKPHFLDTLAAAYAEVGRFDQAIKTARQAYRLLRHTSVATTAEQVRSRIALYESGKPYRQPHNRSP